MQPIKAKRVVMLTGTPISSRPKELFPLIHRLDPASFPNFFEFAKVYCNAHRTRFGWDFNGASNLESLQDKLRRTVMVRRLKQDVFTDLPPKIRQIITLPADGCDAAIHAEQAAFRQHELAMAKLQVEAEMLRLAGDKKGYAAAAKRLKKGSTVAFDEMAKLRAKTALAKVPAVLDHVKETLESTSKVLVFAHHKAVLGKLYKELAEFSPMKIEGGDALTDRQAAVDRFQTDPTCRVAVLSIMAAGVGLTLTAASTVLFAELDWLPSAISQCEDRANRIGQRNTVLVQHLVLDGSIDSRMVDVIIAKQDIADRALDLPADEDDLPADAGEDAVAEAEAALLDRRAAAEEALLAAKAAAAANRDRAAQVELARAEAELAKLETRLAKRETVLDQRPSTKRLTKATLAKKAEKITVQQIEAVHRGLQQLAEMDLDRAMEKNGIGFNKADGVLGHQLACQNELTARFAVIGREICKTYRRQLGEAALKAMGA